MYANISVLSPRATDVTSAVIIVKICGPLMRVGADKEYDMAMKFLQPAIGEVCPHSIVQTMARYTDSLAYLIFFL
jgi:hypothetical protein